MSEYSILEAAVQSGAILIQAADCDTGEVLDLGRAGRGEPRERREPAAARGKCRTGLSKAHNCTSEGEATFWVDGSLMVCKKPKLEEQEQVGGGKRGEVKEFTKTSRRHLLYRIAQISKKLLPHFITLTYPDRWPAERRTWQNHLRRFYQRLRRRFPKLGIVWKLEPQERGAPHFHILAWGLDGSHMALTAIVAKIWDKVVDSGDPYHLKWHMGQLGNGNLPCVGPVHTWRGVMSYASKYLGKVIEGGEWVQPGRFWGVKGSDNIPWASMVRASLNYRESVNLLRLMRRYMHCRRGNLPSLTMLTDNPQYWHERLEKLIT